LAIEGSGSNQLDAENKTIHQPPLANVDLRSQAFQQNPFPTLAGMRELGPVIRVRFPLFGKVWMVTTYDAVNDLLRDHQQFVRNPAASGNRWMAALLRWLPRTLQPLKNNMLMCDEPDHRRLRSLVELAFQRQRIEALRPRLEAIADEALDRLAQQAANSPGGVDLIEHFARPFPLAVICELLGLPPEDRSKFTRWADGLTSASMLGAIFWTLRGLGKMMRYVRDEIERQRRRPGEGLLAALIQADDAGDRLSDDELVAMVFLLLAAGHHTTLHQIAGSVLTLLDHPRQLRELTADWGLADSAAQELLRYISFAQISKPRFARADAMFRGQAVRRGQMLFACLASANSDPMVFENPILLDIHRQPNRHVAFGAGIHVCLGAKLARVETAIALERLFTRFPSLTLATSRSQIRFSPHFGSRSLMALPVKW
jgi:cytochrome P450